jgi:hypothetical protein
MLRSQYDLNCRVVAHFNAGVCWDRHIWETHGARIGIIRRPNNLDKRKYWNIHTWRSAVRPTIPKAKVDSEECEGVPLKPAWLYCDGSPGDRPQRPIGG